MRGLYLLRGPGVLRYGGGASAGVVNAITNRIPNEAIDEPVFGEAIGAYRHNGDGGDFGGLLEGGVGPLAWHLDGLYRKTDDLKKRRLKKRGDVSPRMVRRCFVGFRYLFDRRSVFVCFCPFI